MVNYMKKMYGEYFEDMDYDYDNSVTKEKIFFMRTDPAYLEEAYTKGIEI